jgi:hypothetical protein
MARQYKTLIYLCTVLAALFVILVAIPRNMGLKTGMTQREYEAALAEASDEMLRADTPSERQIAIRHAQKLHKLSSDGRIDEMVDFTWLLNTIRFVIIVSILMLSWTIAKAVYKEAYRLDEPKKGDGTKSSATRT